jgi:predicted DNA-binding transcriptional regulator AlpA
MIIGSRAGKTRRNGLDMQHDQYLNRYRQVEPDILARSPTDARIDVKNLLAALRDNQGRYSTQWSAGEESARYTSQGPETQKKLLDITGIEETYGLKRWTVRTYCSQRKIPFIKIGRRVFFDPAAIEAWIQEHARPVKEVDIS